MYKARCWCLENQDEDNIATTIKKHVLPQESE